MRERLLCHDLGKTVILSPKRGCAAPSTDEKRRHSERYSAKNLEVVNNVFFSPEIPREYARDDIFKAAYSGYSRSG